MTQYSLAKSDTSMVFTNFFLSRKGELLAQRETDYKVYKEKEDAAFHRFAAEHGIESNTWFPPNYILFPGQHPLHIVPTKKDSITFKNQVWGKNPGIFREESEINRAWQLFWEEQEIQVVEEVNLRVEFVSGGHCNITSFLTETGDFYIQIDSENKLPPNNSAKHILGSAYYLALEAYTNRMEESK